jgi:hypothetical protein
MLDKMIVSVAADTRGARNASRNQDSQAVGTTSGCSANPPAIIHSPMNRE